MPLPIPQTSSPGDLTALSDATPVMAADLTDHVWIVDAEPGPFRGFLRLAERGAYIAGMLQRLAFLNQGRH